MSPCVQELFELLDPAGDLQVLFPEVVPEQPVVVVEVPRLAVLAAQVIRCDMGRVIALMMTGKLSISLVLLPRPKMQLSKSQLALRASSSDPFIAQAVSRVSSMQLGSHPFDAQIC